VSIDPSIVTCLQAVTCAECAFLILPGQPMGLALDGWRHPLCLPLDTALHLPEETR
jgi:hypothetical protein